MDPDRWSRIEAVFHRALALDSAERTAWLARECGDDADLRTHVERLLAADAAPNDLVDRLEGGALLPTEDPLIGRDVGPYRLTSRIAVGGMGVVYRAERTDGLFRKEVAVKLLRIELATESLVRRFEFERRTLAALRHPNIAQLIDGGATADGRPYLVMELVRGTAIDRYCEEQRLSIVDRLRLFAQVCRAVHFAHQNLVVHRDLKPSNILIDEGGAPKLLDFGIARILDEAADPEAGRTVTGARMLTPDYASPEQLTMGPVTTSMDVYSLGVVLYELLTGRRPFRSDTKSPIEWQRAVIERPPTRPSNMVDSVDVGAGCDVSPSAAPAVGPEERASRRGCTPRSLRRRLRGDLDRIVLMALRKEPERRYGSAKDLADDVERHLSGHPVLARGDSIVYRTVKFAQRNRLAVASSTVVIAALVFVVIVARRGEARAREQAAHARIEAESSQGTAEFLLETFLTTVTSLDEAQLEQRRLRIGMHAERLRREFDGQEHLRANLLDALGRVAERIGVLEDARALIQEALDIRARTFGDASLEYALSLRSLAHWHYTKGELAPAAELLSRALVIHRTRADETHTDVASIANDLAACLRGLGRLEEAEVLHREALALRRHDGDGSLAVAESLNNLAGIALDRNDLPTAVAQLEEAVAIRTRILGAGELLTLQSTYNLAMTLWRKGERDRARELIDRVEKGNRALRADGEEELAHVLSNKAAMLVDAGDLAAAAPLIAEALALQERRYGSEHPAVASTLTKLAQLQELSGRPTEARESWRRIVSIRRAPGGSPRYLAQALCDSGAFSWRTGEREEALAAVRESTDVFRAAGMDRSPAAARARVVYGEFLLATGDVAGARESLEDAASVLSADPHGTESELVRVRDALARCSEIPKK